MEFSKDQAQIRQDVAKARLLAMDESKTQEERLKAINSVMANELKMTTAIIEMQKKKVAAKREELTLNKTMIEDEEELMALEVELINLTTSSTMTQKRLMLEVETLTNEMVAKNKTKEKARIKSKKQDDKALAKYNLTRLKNETDEAFTIRMDAAKEEQKLAEESAKVLAALSKENLLAEINNLKERALKSLEIEHEAKLKELEGHENFLELKAELDKKYAREKGELDEMDVENAELIADKKKAVHQEMLSNITSILTSSLEAQGHRIEKEYKKEMKLAEANGKSTENIEAKYEGKRKALAEKQKKLKIGLATIDMFQSVIAAYNQGMSVPPPAGLVMGPLSAGFALAAGLANINSIMQTDVGGGGGGGAAPTGGGSQTPAPQMMSGQFELGGGVEPEAFKAYVVTDEMSNSQNQLANIRRRATI
jgi:hypothetical protein